jgi:hypothetical protein
MTATFPRKKVSIWIGDLKKTLIEQAEEAHKQYPQYEGHWRTWDWDVAKIRRKVRTKMGIAFEIGDIVLVRRQPGLTKSLGWTAYSFRNSCDTAVLRTDFFLLDEMPGNR